MTEKITLLPVPQQLMLTGGVWEIPDNGTIALHARYNADLFFTACQLQKELVREENNTWDIVSTTEATIVLRNAVSGIAQQGYHLTITSNGILIEANDAAGVFYGVMTLKQLIQTHGRVLPNLRIEDHPDFAVRGVMLDISRDNVPTMETLFELIDTFACWKINQLQLYTEHTFAYRLHRKVWENASPITAEEALILDAYCRERFIDFVPNQNSFGHMNRWFEHAEYLPLAESEPGTFKSWYFPMQTPMCLAPAVGETLDFLKLLYDELLPNFTSQQFNVNCDETFDLGMGKSKALVESQGKGRVYLDYLLKIYNLVSGYGRTMQYWGDIITQYPELVPELPKDAIALDWGYDVGYRYPETTRMFADSGVPYYVCPGTSAWWSILGRSDNCIGNIREAAEYGLKNGAVGLLNTDWGDTAGYRHFLPNSYLGFVCGAMYSWALEANRDVNIVSLLNTFVFHDTTGEMGRIAYDLGNAYKHTGILSRDGSLLYSLYPRPLSELRVGLISGLRKPEYADILLDDEKLSGNLRETHTYIESVMSRLGNTRMQRHDAELIGREYRLMANFALHGAKRGLIQLGESSITRETLHEEHRALLDEYPALWLARSRSGGLNDTMNRLEKAVWLFQTS